MIARLLSGLAGIRWLPLAVALCVGVAGCADTSNMSPAQAALEKSKQRFIVTTAEGVAAGALLGALVGGLAGGGRGALIGAAAGGVAGGVAGAMVAQNNYNQSHSEASLNAYINEANQQAADARQDATYARQIAAEARGKAAQLRAQYRAGTITSAQYRAQLNSYSRSIEALRDVSRGQAEQIAAYQRDGASAGGQGTDLRQAAVSIARSKQTVDDSINDVARTLAAEPS